MSNDNPTTKTKHTCSSSLYFHALAGNVCETLHKLHIHIGEMALSSSIQTIL